LTVAPRPTGGLDRSELALRALRTALSRTLDTRLLTSVARIVAGDPGVYLAPRAAKAPTATPMVLACLRPLLSVSVAKGKPHPLAWANQFEQSCGDGWIGVQSHRAPPGSRRNPCPGPPPSRPHLSRLSATGSPRLPSLPQSRDDTAGLQLPCWPALHSIKPPSPLPLESNPPKSTDLRGDALPE
jgi:hypothetical protein